jgi:predicted dehydrogenase
VISETTAAPTLGECLDLVECCERTGRKYMLAANCPTMVGPGELMRVYRSGELGEVLYAEAEYLHPTTEAESLSLAPTETHWRRFIPGTYYNMHSLGVLMTATGLLPKRVTAMEIYTDSCRNRATVLNNKSAGSIALYQMDNGSVFRSTGWCTMSPSGKWFRLTCEGGTIETERENQDRVLLRRKGKGLMKYDPDNQYTKEEKKEGHGGADARICRQICDYLSGKVEEPLLDIYRGVTLSMAGIYGLHSILDGKTYDIPDIRNKEEREILRGDYRSPFPGKDGRPTLPFGKDRT